MRAKRLLPLGLLLLLVLLAGLWWIALPARPPSAAPEVLGAMDAESPGAAAVANVARGRVTAIDAGPAAPDPRRAPPAARQEAPAFPTERFEPEAYDLPRMAIFGRFWRTAEEEWNASRFQTAMSEKEYLDGRQSYQVYVYLRTCLDAPRSNGELDVFLDRLGRAATGDMNERGLQRLTRVLDRAEAGLTRCAGLAGDLEPAALEWLTRAAERGYPLAQIAFYRSFRWLAGRRPYLLFGDGDALWRYRRLAPRFLEAALRSGHAEAFVEMAQGLADGIVFERDPEAAYAHALAADLAADGLPRVGENLRRELESELEPDARRRAEARARVLCDRYCL